MENKRLEKTKNCTNLKALLEREKEIDKLKKSYEKVKYKEPVSQFVEEFKFRYEERKLEKKRKSLKIRKVKILYFGNKGRGRK